MRLEAFLAFLALAGGAAPDLARAAQDPQAPAGCEWRAPVTGANASWALWCVKADGQWAQAEVNEDFDRQTLAKAAAGDPAAMRALGEFLVGDGPEAQADAEAGAQWLKKAAEQGDVEAMSRLGQVVEDGDGAPEDIVEAMRWYRMAADRGDTEAMKALSRLSVDRTVAFGWMKKAADQGDAAAIAQLAGLYFRGDGVEANHTEGLRLAQFAGDKGDGGGYGDIAVAYLHGQGVERNLDEALRLGRLAGDKGDPDYLSNMGVMLAMRRQDPDVAAKALVFFREAAERGSAVGAFNLARQLLYGGPGVARDPVEGLRWLRAAAERGNPQAAALLRTTNAQP